MKVETPQISWHGAESDHGRNAPLLSLSVLESGLAPEDDQPDGAPSNAGGGTGGKGKRKYGTVLATAGNDGVVHLWRLSFRHNTNTNDTPNRVRLITDPTSSDATTRITHLTSLTRHERSVNCVQFSPDGLHLATAGDGGSIVIYSVPPDRRGNGNGRHHWADVSREKDLVCKLANTSGSTTGGGEATTGRCEDVLDLSWNVDSRSFAVASLDHSTLVFELSPKNGWNCVRRFADHTHYVQGVSHDPLGVYVATQGADRTVRVYRRPRPRPEGTNGNKGKRGGGGLGRATTIKYWSQSTDPTQQQQRGGRPSAEGKDGDEATSAAVPPAPSSSTAPSAAPLDNITNGASPQKSTAGDATTTSRTTQADGQPQPQPQQQQHATRRRHLFADESTVESFFRRLSWTADGAYLIAPSAGPSDWSKGMDEGGKKDQEEATSFGTYLFARHRYDAPVAVLAGLSKPSVVVRPCPVLFELPKGKTPSSDMAPAHMDDGNDDEAAKENRSIQAQSSPPPSPPLSSSASLPHRSVFAVLTLDAVLVYDTHHRHPLARAGGLHYSGLTDAAWTADGRRLLVTSSDGYVSVLSFDEGELGTEMAVVPASTAAAESTAARPAPVTPARAPLPPCPAGQSAALVAPRSKRAKTSSAGAADENAGGGTGAAKRRITPTLVSVPSPLSTQNNNQQTRVAGGGSPREMDSNVSGVGSRHDDDEDDGVDATLENKVTDLKLDHEGPTSFALQQQQQHKPPKKKKKRIAPTLLRPA